MMRTPFNFAVCFLCHVSSVLPSVIEIPLWRAAESVNEAVYMESSGPHRRSVRDAKGVGSNLSGRPGLGYYIEMGIGTPPQMMNVLIDTGSSNFAIAAADHIYLEKYFNTSLSTTFQSSRDEVTVPYTQGNWQGYLASDSVSIPSMNLTVEDATLSCITSSENFFINNSHWQGILGLAYAQIARPDPSVEPLFDDFVRHGLVNDTFSMQLCGSKEANSPESTMAGTLVLGGISDSLYTGDIFYVPIHETWYYEVVITDIKVDGQSLDMDCKEYNYDKTIVDSGTTNLRLPKRVFSKVISLLKDKMQASINLDGIPVAFWDGSESDILCPENGSLPWDSFPSVEVHLGMSPNTSFGLKVGPHHYLRAVKDVYYPSSNRTCFKFAIAQSETGTVLGAVLMEGYYVVFDRVNQQIGFAQTTCPNVKQTSENIIQPYLTKGNDNWDCAFTRYHGTSSTLVTVAYVMAGICGACLIPLVIMIVHWQYVKWRKQRSDNYGLLNEEALDR